MTRRHPGDLPGPFTPAELEGIADVAHDELAADRLVARKLEALADRGTVRPSADFADRVMASIAGQPSPAPVRAAGAAVRRRSLVALLASFRDAGRVTFGAGFPVAARAQALALVLVVGGVVATSGAVTAGALGAFTDHGPAPQPTQSVASPVVTQPASSPATFEPTDGTQPPTSSIAPDVTGTPEASDPPSGEPTDSGEPEEAPNRTSAGGSGTGGGNDPGGTRPPSTPRPTPTPEGTPSPTEGGDHHWSPRPEPSHSPRPTEAPHGDGWATPTPTAGH
jgi:hypothetical protein